jgi:hypothetical protein
MKPSASASVARPVVPIAFNLATLIARFFPAAPPVAAAAANIAKAPAPNRNRPPHP